MRRTFLLQLVAAGAFGLATTATAQTLVPRVELVGFTTAIFKGGTIGGVFPATLQCQAEFPGSRICSEQEIINTVNVPVGLVGSAWVGPSAWQT